MIKNILNLLCHTIAAYTEKIKSMRQYFKAGFVGNFFGHIPKAGQVRINYFMTLDADHMWMGIRSITVIAVASICKAEF